MSDKPKIAFYGLGAMGGGMAINLAKTGYNVTGYDLYKPLQDKLVSAGGHPSSSPANAASSSSAPIAIIMVATMHQANALLFTNSSDPTIPSTPAAPALAKNSTLILCSTCPPSYPPQLRQSLDDAGRSDITLLDCPVSGGTIRAASGDLSIFASGPESALSSAPTKAVLDTMSANLYLVGSELGAGQKVKAIHQLMAATNIISASEAMGLAATAGLDTEKVVQHVKGGNGTSFMFENRAPHMLADDWSPLSALGIIWKDAGIVVDAAREIRFPVPLCSAAEQLYSMGNQRGLLKDDDAKLVTMYIAKAGPSKVAELKGSGKDEGQGGVTVQDIDDLLAGIHLAASVEAMAFCKALGMDRKLMYEIISKAAGWAKMFTEHMPGMLEGDDWSLASCKGADERRERLEKVIDKCRSIGFPSQMGTTALQSYYFAGLER